MLREESCMQQDLFEHCQSPGHTGSVEDVCITFVDKRDPIIIPNVNIIADKH